jgi:hypothetical protein
MFRDNYVVRTFQFIFSCRSDDVNKNRGHVTLMVRTKQNFSWESLIGDKYLGFGCVKNVGF